MAQSMSRASKISVWSYWPGKAGGSGAVVTGTGLPRGPADSTACVLSVVQGLARPGLCTKKAHGAQVGFTREDDYLGFRTIHSQAAVMTIMQGLCIAILVAKLLAPNPD